MLARIALATAVLLSILGPTLGQTARETKEQFEARTKWWREAKFGMFIHWGIYAVPADCTTRDGRKSIAEWYLSNKQMQVKDYEKFAAQFNPVKFDAKKWVATAKQAGMKYIVITSKHHDGFCMFDSKLTDYCITKATPFKRDPMRELAQECRRQGLRLCFYYSIMDWHHPDYLPRRPWEQNVRPATGADLNRYIEYMKGQLRELLTNYGPIGVIWFDGGWEHNAQELRSEEVNRMIRSIQPSIIINDRNHLPEDHATPEQTIPAGALPGGRLWETCMTINDTWGYAKNDTNWKPAEDLIRKLCDIASKGGNFLLNVGPTAEGEFPPEIMERLAAIGRWMKVNGESIYGTTQSPFRRLSFDGRCTVKGNNLYLHVFRWPEEGLT
ncbi:MAG: alpha-L-fucosidase, partial [Armatimonadota bacterium]